MYSSKSQIDGLRYVNDQDHLKTPIGKESASKSCSYCSITSYKITSSKKGRALIRYSLSRQCLGDLFQSCSSQVRLIREYYSSNGLFLQPTMSHVTDALYALYNINFQLLPPCLCELDVNWPQSDIRSGRSQTMPAISNPFPTVADQFPPLPSEKVQKWLSSGIGSIISEKEIENREDSAAGNINANRKAEMEVKQEIMAQVITDLEMKNSKLETQLNQNQEELNQNRNTGNRTPPKPNHLSLEINPSTNINADIHSIIPHLRHSSTPYSLQVPLTPNKKLNFLRRLVKYNL